LIYLYFFVKNHKSFIELKINLYHNYSLNVNTIIDFIYIF